MIRQPIVSILGHVDHGKTSLLDKIRSSTVAAKEAGGITQAIGATDVPLDAVKRVAGSLLQKFRIDVKIPGLLFIDTPGHEAFTSLRKRGGSIADLAVLVVDINEGFKPQTEESLELLKSFKTPFVVAANKIDMIDKWRSADKPFIENYANQSDEAKTNFDIKFYDLVAKLSEKGFNAERFDRIKDFTKEIAIIPCAGREGEGVPDLLVMLTGLAQQFLTNKLELSSECKGAVLEVKDLRGFGMTIDAILYDGSAKPGDYLVVGGSSPVVTKIKALLKPEPLKEIRVEKQFKAVSEANAATGVKIAAPNLDGVKSGSPIRITGDQAKAQSLLNELIKEKEDVEFELAIEGIILKADSLGSLEAMINIFKKHLPIRRAALGPVDKKDIMEAKGNPDPFKRLIFAFNVPVNDTDPAVTVIDDKIIYRILERYEEFLEKTKKGLELEKLKDVTRPAKFMIIPGFVFRGNNPAIVGVEISAGMLKPGASVMTTDGKIIGTVKNIQNQSETVQEAKPSQRVAVSIEGPTVGRQIKEGDTLYTSISEREYKTLLELKDVISKSEFDLLSEIAAMKRKEDPNWGLY